MNKVVECRRGEIFDEQHQSMRNSQQHLLTHEDKMHTGVSGQNTIDSPATSNKFR